MKKLLLLLIVALFVSINGWAQCIPDYLKGNWLKTDGSNTWLIGFHHKFAIYQSDFWEYQKVEQIGTDLILELSKGNSRKAIRVRAGKHETMLFSGISKDDEILSLSKIDNSQGNLSLNVDSEGFERLSICNDSVVINGYITNYDPLDPGFEIGEIIVNNFLKKELEVFHIKVESDGTFRSAFPLSYPQGNVTVKLGPCVCRCLFAVPGGIHFLFVDQTAGEEPRFLFMGEESALSAEIRDFEESLSRVRSYTAHENRSNLFGSYTDVLYQQYLSSNSTSKKFNQYYGCKLRYKNANDQLINGRSHYYKMSDLSFELTNLLMELPLNEEISILSKEYFDFLKEIQDFCQELVPKVPLILNGEEEMVIAMTPAESLERLARYCNLSTEERNLCLKVSEQSGLYSEDIPGFMDLQDTYEADFRVISGSFFTKGRMEAVVGFMDAGLARNIILTRIILEQLAARKILNEEAINYFESNCSDTFLKEVVKKEIDLRFNRSL